MTEPKGVDEKLAATDQGPEPVPWLEELPPRQIVAELDRYIVGQDAAKRAVAIAVRNRWRRAQAPDNIRDEILPNNIIMIGPTGVGKTEIARRLARLAGAPFIKVEASKFTEVGYVGRDVDSLDWVPQYDANGLSQLYHPAADLVQRILKEKKPGSIVSLTIGRPQTNLAFEGGFVGGRGDYLFQKLDVLLNGLIREGYKAVTVSTLMAHAR